MQPVYYVYTRLCIIDTTLKVEREREREQNMSIIKEFYNCWHKS